MARQPFYGRGPGPAIARMDMNAATAPGRAYGQMFATLGKIAGDSIEKYAEGKKKKEEQDELIKGTKAFIMGNPELGRMLNIQATDDISYEDAVNQAVPSLIKNPKGLETIKGLTAMAAQQRKAQQETELFNRKISQFDRSQDTADELKQSATNIAKFNFTPPEIPITGETPAAFLPELDPDPFVGPPTTYQGQAPAVAQLPESFQLQGEQVFDAVQSGQLSPLEGNRIMGDIRAQAMAEQKAGPTRSEDLAERKFQRQIVNEDKENQPLPPVDSKYEEATLTAIDDALGFLTDDTKKFFSTGVIGQALSNIAGTEATSLRAKLDTITSGVGFGRLNDMREASKTGGALGNVSEIELRQLNASMGSLDPNQKPSELKKTLETIKEHYESTVRVLKAEKYAYDNGYTFKTPKEAMDFVERYNNLNASSPQQTTNTIDPSAPASQATLDALEKKRQLRSNRAGL